MLTTKREKLADALRSAGRFTVKSVKPELEFVHVSVAGGVLTLRATNIESGIELKVECDGKLNPVCLPCKQFASFCQLATSDELTMKMEGSDCVVSASRSKMRIPTMAADVFPVIKFGGDAVGSVSEAVVETLGRVHMLCDECQRYAIQGVLLDFHENELFVVATDGRRAARARFEGKFARQSLILPRPFCSTLKPRRCDVYCDGNRVEFRSERETAWTRLVAGRFPRHEDMFAATANGHSTDIPLHGLVNATRIAAIAHDEQSAYRSTLRLSRGTLSIDREETEGGEAAAEIPVPYDGDECHVTLNAKYLGDAAKVCTHETGRLVILKDMEAAMVDSGNVTYLLMGMN